MEYDFLYFATGVALGALLVGIMALGVIRYIAVSEANKSGPTFARTFYAAASLLDEWSSDADRNSALLLQLRNAVVAESNHTDQGLDIDRMIAAEPRYRAALRMVINYLQHGNAYPHSDQALIAVLTNTLEETNEAD